MKKHNKNLTLPFSFYHPHALQHDKHVFYCRLNTVRREMGPWHKHPGKEAGDSLKEHKLYETKPSFVIHAKCVNGG
jgi:hypothetical protein